MVLTVAFDYGGHAELMSAVRAARAAGGPITQDAIARNLYLPGAPTGRSPGAHERRAAGLELLVVAERRRHDPLLRRSWPDFDADELDVALALVQ